MGEPSLLEIRPERIPRHPDALAGQPVGLPRVCVAANAESGLSMKSPTAPPPGLRFLEKTVPFGCRGTRKRDRAS